MSTRLIADGTEPPKVSGVYQVSILDHLEWISTNSGSWGADFIQTANIDATDTQNWNSGAGFSPIGRSYSPFNGTYDGDGHTIYGLYISTSGDYCSLFGYTNGANISNLGVINVNISAYGQVGGLVGHNYGTITKCYSTGIVNGTTNRVGGLVGVNFGTVSNCYSTGSVTGSNNSVGGLVGYNPGTVSNCYSTGSVNGKYNVGGLVGDNPNTVSNCYSTGSVYGDAYVGGLVGQNRWGTVTECYSTGSVTGPGNYVGGLVGWNWGGTVTECYSTGSVTGVNCVGGLVGENEGLTAAVTECYSTGSVNGTTSRVGGLVGQNSGGTVSNSFWDTETSGQTTSAGGGFGKTTAEMKTQSTFTSAGWDFCTIWQITEPDYPVFKGDTHKVLVCHKGHTICISQNAIPAHLAHGDYLGNCGDKLVSMPTEYELHANYPNPFNPMTRIDYSLPFDSKVRLQIFDALGREVVTLVNDNQRAGYYTVDFNASNLASGIYYYRMLAGDFNAIKKMVLLK